MSFLEYYRGKNIVITGALSGLSLALIKKLSPIANNIFCIDVKELNDQLSKGIDNIKYYQVDVSDQEKMTETINDILKVHDVDIVFANAGIDGSASVKDFDLNFNKRVMDVNYLGVVNSTVPFFKNMLKQKSGHIIGISSVAVFKGVYKSAPYFSSKAALSVFLESIRLEFRKENINVTTVFPGFIRTGITCDSDLPSILPLGVDEAVIKILKGVAKKKTRITFPWQLRLICFFNRLLPDFIFDRVSTAAYEKASQ